MTLLLIVIKATKVSKTTAIIIDIIIIDVDTS